MSSLVARIDRIDIRRAGIILFGGVAIMAVMGLWAVNFDPGNPWFDLDAEVHPRWPLEQTTIAIPAVWSSLLLVWAAVVWLAASTLVVRRLTRLLFAALGFFLFFMAADELVTIHEHLRRWLGIDRRVGPIWMILYAPPVALMAVVVLIILFRLWRVDRRAVVLLVAACAAWGFAQLLELIQWHGEVPIPEYVLLMVPEELGEAAGSICSASRE